MQDVTSLTPLDFSVERPPTAVAARGPAPEKYDPEPQREKLRGWIAVGLVVVFALAIAASFFLFWWFPDKTADVNEFLPLGLAPLTSVVGAVVGFCYGARTRRGD
ncbi:MAG: hypothetical protein K6T74_03870 [Geminicoccaceae bacterium]|nr:hypothetical protein [Geminicoccaceae bacterium]